MRRLGDPSSLISPRLRRFACSASIFCHKCEGLCPKECKVGTKTIDSVQATQDLVGCTHVEGSLILNLRQGCQYPSWSCPSWPCSPAYLYFLHGFPSPRVLSLCSYLLCPSSSPPCGPITFPGPAAALSSSSPDNLEPELQRNLGLVETITGFLKIKHSFALVSLGFFKNLKLIRGDSMVDG